MAEFWYPQPLRGRAKKREIPEVLVVFDGFCYR